MKTILIFIALAPAALGQTSEAKPKWSPDVSYTSSAAIGLRSAITAKLIEKYDIVWMSNTDAGKLLSINGLSSIIPVGWSDNSTGHVFTAKETSRPEKPEEITAELWTKDGKHWKAKWEEVK